MNNPNPNSSITFYLRPQSSPNQAQLIQSSRVCGSGYIHARTAQLPT